MAETIKEFLVGLGYRVDGSSEAKFKNSVEAATKSAIALGTILTGVAVATTAAITKIAKGFDDLYYMSQRTNASVANIKAVGYAVSQLGGSYQGATDSIEAFGQKLRSNPGFGSLVRSLGVATEQNGKLRDTVEIARDLAKTLQSKPYYVQLQYMEALGLDERTYRALQSGDLVRYIEEYRKKQEALGVNQDQAARVGRDLSNAWRQLGATAEALGEKLLISLGPQIERIIKRFDDFLMNNSEQIKAFFTRLAEIAEDVTKAFIRLVEKGDGPIVDMFAKIEKAVDSLQVVLAAFAAFLVGSWLVRILGAFGAVGTGFGAMLLKLGINPATLGFVAGMYPSTANGGEDEEIARRRANGTWGGSNAFNGSNGIKDNRNWWQRTMPKFLGGKDAPTASSGGSNAPIRGSTFTQKAPGIMRRLMDDFGFTKEQAAGILGNLGHESSGLNELQERNPTAGRGGYGWAQWTGPRRKAFEAWAAANNLDPASDEANYGFLRHELRTNHAGVVARVKEAGSVGEAMVAFEAGYERAGVKNYASRQKWADRALRAAERAANQPGNVVPYTPFSGINAGSMAAVQSNAALIGAGITPLAPAANSNATNVDMTQKTEITVFGGSDPAATGAAVADAQKGVNGTMLRNMQGAVR
ncbi:phage tail tip lysozyme [Bosea sp. AS-1]|uniref:phage tail tip lysozyme n=1 Tax=Bosea sp. AS-1 TaxID=2015316 RepID=UPI000B7931FF|nr:phage tail tip lysozyme [Bosea sp. AS-1]